MHVCECLYAGVCFTTGDMYIASMCGGGGMGGTSESKLY